MAQPSSLALNPIISVIPLTSYYCDPGDIQRRLSIEGIKARTQDYGKASVAGESGVIEDSIWEATEIVNFYCFNKYEPGSLMKSAWVNRRATDIAVYYLESRRGNVPSGSITAAYKQTLDWLERVHMDIFQIPGVPLRHTMAPAFTNFHINQRYSTYRVRVESGLSDKSPAPYAQAIDWSSAFDYIF